MSQKLSYTDLLEIIDQVKSRLQQDPIVQKTFQDYGCDLEEITYVPICFAKLDVSARTDHGIIYLNEDLIKDGDFNDDDHYLVHELTHFCQQTTGDGPTEGSTDDTYLDNKYEQEGFQNQTAYLSETQGDGVASEYVDQVLDHHDVPKQEKEKKKRELLQLAVQRFGLKKVAKQLR